MDEKDNVLPEKDTKCPVCKKEISHLDLKEYTVGFGKIKEKRKACDDCWNNLYCDLCNDLCQDTKAVTEEFTSISGKAITRTESYCALHRLEKIITRGINEHMSNNIGRYVYLHVEGLDLNVDCNDIGSILMYEELDVYKVIELLWKNIPNDVDKEKILEKAKEFMISKPVLLSPPMRNLKNWMERRRDYLSSKTPEELLKEYEGKVNFPEGSSKMLIIQMVLDAEGKMVINEIIDERDLLPSKDNK